MALHHLAVSRYSYIKLIILHYQDLRKTKEDLRKTKEDLRKTKEEQVIDDNYAIIRGSSYHE